MKIANVRPTTKINAAKTELLKDVFRLAFFGAGVRVFAVFRFFLGLQPTNRFFQNVGDDAVAFAVQASVDKIRIVKTVGPNVVFFILDAKTFRRVDKNDPFVFANLAESRQFVDVPNRRNGTVFSQREPTMKKDDRLNAVFFRDLHDIFQNHAPSGR